MTKPNTAQRMKRGPAAMASGKTVLALIIQAPREQLLLLLSL